jgi:hypothetical protein
VTIFCILPNVRENFKFRPFNKARWGKRVTAPLKGGYIVEIQGVRYASIISRWQDAILDKQLCQCLWSLLVQLDYGGLREI